MRHTVCIRLYSCIVSTSTLLWGAITIIIGPKYSMKLDWFSIGYYRLILHKYNDILDHRLMIIFRHSVWTKSSTVKRVIEKLFFDFREIWFNSSRIFYSFFSICYFSTFLHISTNHFRIFFCKRKKNDSKWSTKLIFVHFIFRKHTISNTHWMKGKLTKLRIILFCSTKMKRCPRNN